MNTIEYKSGDVYGLLMLTGKCYMREYGGQARRFIECICECGKTFFSYYSPIIQGKVKSCGCKKRGHLISINTTHGMLANGEYPTLYGTWQAMIQRCTNDKVKNADYYIKKGITVCPEWINSFENFNKWALANGWSSELSLDRIDNNGNYDPLNCRWATRHEQARNRSNNVFLIAFGETKCVNDWLKDHRCKVTHNTLYYRLNVNKMNHEDAIKTPPKNK